MEPDLRSPYSPFTRASDCTKGAGSVAADDEATQILTAAKDLELDGDGAERHRYLIKRKNGVLERRRHKAQ